MTIGEAVYLHKRGPVMHDAKGEEAFEVRAAADGMHNHEAQSSERLSELLNIERTRRNGKRVLFCSLLWPSCCDPPSPPTQIARHIVSATRGSAGALRLAAAVCVGGKPGAAAREKSDGERAVCAGPARGWLASLAQRCWRMRWHLCCTAPSGKDNHMNPLDRLIPTPRLLEVDEQVITAPVLKVWQAVRHGDLGRSSTIRMLFALRTLPERLRGRDAEGAELRIDALQSTPEHPGFRVLCDEPPHIVAVGAIGKVWLPDIPFVHVEDSGAFAAFHEPDYVKVAWALVLEATHPERTRLSIEVRVDATDDAAWHKFVSYFRLIGPFSRFIRRSALRSLARELGEPEPDEACTLKGDELLPDGAAQLTLQTTMRATPERIWPWLVQMGCDRAGFYSYDALDNNGKRSARELHPEWQELHVGQLVAATPEGEGGFEVLRIEPERVLILGGLFDSGTERQLPFASARPASYWQVTWAFVLEPLDAERTRLWVRARAAFSDDQSGHARVIRPVHVVMESAQLRHLRARVEGTLARDDARDVMEGLGGAAHIALNMITPFLRDAHSHWGLSLADAHRQYPGDELVRTPRWSWTHGIETAAEPQAVWPWIAQIGATRGGFYSYQWLENLVGCEVHNAEAIHPEWEMKLGDELYVHPKAPALKIAALERGRWLVAHGPADQEAKAAGRPWVAVSWLFYVEPIEGGKSRCISRYRADYSDDLRTRVSFGPSLLEPIGFAMDRRMLLGVKERAERSHVRALPAAGRRVARAGSA